MKNFYIIWNPEKQGAKEWSCHVRDYLIPHGAECYVSSGSQENRESRHYTDPSRVPDLVQCVITLGGDGTLIQAARDLAGRNLPLFGINRGTLGYLTQVSGQEEIYAALDALLHDEFSLEDRMMLRGRIFRQGREEGQDIALNEIVIARNEGLGILRFKVYLDGEFLNEYRADGMIVATPTGSTAYNLSAGGPVLVPSGSMKVLTPICSHALSARSIVMSGESRLRIEALGTGESCQAAVFDGDYTVKMNPGDFIEIEKSETKTVLVKLKNLSFLDNLRNKMASI